MSGCWLLLQWPFLFVSRGEPYVERGTLFCREKSGHSFGGSDYVLIRVSGEQKKVLGDIEDYRLKQLVEDPSVQQALVSGQLPIGFVISHSSYYLDMDRMKFDLLNNPKVRQLIQSGKLTEPDFYQLRREDRFGEPGYIFIDRDVVGDNEGPFDALTNDKVLDALLEDKLQMNDVMHFTNQSYEVIDQNDGIWSWVVSGGISVEDLSQRIYDSLEMTWDYAADEVVELLTAEGMSELFMLEPIRQLFGQDKVMEFKGGRCIEQERVTVQEIAACRSTDLELPLNKAIIAAFSQLEELTNAYHRCPVWKEEPDLDMMLSVVAEDSPLGGLMLRVIQLGSFSNYGNYDDPDFKAVVSGLSEAHWQHGLAIALKNVDPIWKEHHESATAIQTMVRGYLTRKSVLAGGGGGAKIEAKPEHSTESPSKVQ